MLTAIALTFALTLLAVYAGWRARAWSLRHRPAPEQRSEKRCGVCQVELPKSSLRTHTGQWRCVMHKTLIVSLLAVPASAQTVKTITVVPINFQNDTRQPLTVQQILDQWAHWTGWTDTATNGLMRLDINVLPYTTLPYDRQYGVTAAGTDRGCYKTPMTETWEASAIAAAKSAGHTIVGQSWVYSPQTFGMCSEVDRRGYMMHGHYNLGFFVAQFFGLNSFMPAWTTICTDAAGGYVPLSNKCAFNNRTFQSITGQGGGAFTCVERTVLQTMPSARVRTIAANAALPQTFEIVPLEQTPTGDQIQCLTVSAYAVGITPIGTITGVTLELHKDTAFSRDWQTAGLSGHINGTSRLLDFTPDGRVVWPGQAGTSTLNPGESFTLNGVRTTVGAFTPSGGLTVTLSAAGSEEPVPPPPPPPPPPTDPAPGTSPNCTLAPTVTDSAGGIWAFGASNATATEILRNGVKMQGYAKTSGNPGFWWADGAVYVYGTDDQWWKWRGGNAKDFDSPSRTKPACSGQPTPPPAPEWAPAVSGTIEPHVTRQEWRLTLPSGVVVVIPKP